MTEVLITRTPISPRQIRWRFSLSRNEPFSGDVSTIFSRPFLIFWQVYNATFCISTVGRCSSPAKSKRLEAIGSTVPGMSFFERRGVRTGVNDRVFHRQLSSSTYEAPQLERGRCQLRSAISPVSSPSRLSPQQRPHRLPSPPQQFPRLRFCLLRAR